MARRTHGTGHLWEQNGVYYGRWRASDGRNLNRRIGPKRRSGSRDGLTKTQAERKLRSMQEDEERRPRPARDDARHTVDEAATSLRRQLALQGARKSYLEGCESMQRVHVRPTLGDRAL